MAAKTRESGKKARRPEKRRKADAKARVTLFDDFASADLLIQRVSADEVRVRKAKRSHRFTLAELLAGVTPENLHAEISTGPPVGREAW